MKSFWKNRDVWMFAVIVVVSAGVGTYFYQQYQISYEEVSAACKPGQFCSSFVTPSSVNEGGTYSVGCNYGFVGSGIYATSPTGASCTYSKFVGKTAEFTCTAGSQAGTFATTCGLDSAAPYATRADKTQTINVNCPAGTFCGSSVSASSVAPGGTYTLSCDYGFVGSGVYVNSTNSSCTYEGFSGTAAQFKCAAGTTAGTITNTCRLSSPAPYKTQTNTAPSVTITGSGSSSGSTGNSSSGGSATTTAGLIPSNAIAVSNLDASGNWAWEHDAGTPGTSTGTTMLVTTPSLDGQAREFSFSYSGDGGERYHITFANDTSATHFVYDTWVDLATPVNVQNLELDMNQVISNGDTVIFGTQCSSDSGTWEYTSEVPKGHWISSNIPCNPTTWTPNTWHHIQIATERDASGNVTYEWISFDGKVSYFNNAVANAADSLGWNIGTLLINFQIDGKNGSGSVKAYADKTTVWRW